MWRLFITFERVLVAFIKSKLSDSKYIIIWKSLVENCFKRNYLKLLCFNFSEDIFCQCFVTATHGWGITRQPIKSSESIQGKYLFSCFSVNAGTFSWIISGGIVAHKWGLFNCDPASIGYRLRTVSGLCLLFMCGRKIAYYMFYLTIVI